MRVYTKQHNFYCGRDLHARTMDLCIVNQEGEIGLHRKMQAAPEPFLKAMAPDREDLVVAVACLLTWYWLAALCAQAQLPCVLGPALSMKAIHGGKANNDTIDAQKLAVLRRGGMLPQAYVYPAAMRAPRDWLRRRFHLTRQRAELLAHVQPTNSQDHLPEIGKQLAYKANRDGVAERCPDPAVQKRVAVDLALMDYDDPRLSAVALTIVQTAQQHQAQARYRRQSVPGIGKMLRVVLLDAMHDLSRFPRGQEFVS
jgi:transposase